MIYLIIYYKKSYEKIKKKSEVEYSKDKYESSKEILIKYLNNDYQFIGEMCINRIR